MGIQLETTARNASCDAVVDLLDGGTGAGYIEIRTGTTVGAGTLLATIPLNDPAFGAASSGAATIDADPTIEDTAADATGTAAHFEAYDGDDARHFSGTVTATGSGGDLELNTVEITAGVAVQITGGTITMPAGSLA